VSEQIWLELKFSTKPRARPAGFWVAVRGLRSEAKLSKDLLSIPSPGSSNTMLPHISAVLFAALGNTNQQWMGPTADTGQAVIFKPSCDAQGKNCKKCLDLAGGSTDNGTPIDIWDCLGNTNQKWVYGQDLAIRYQANTSKCIDLPGSSTTNGNKLWLWDCNGGNQQQWNGGGVYQFESGLDSTKCMDLGGGDTTNGNKLEIWDCTGGPTPAPAPGRTHYEDSFKYDGCLSDEESGVFPGVSGHFCAPYCGSDGSCPQDKPTGVTATPKCISVSGGGKECFLFCSSLPGTAKNATDGQCGANGSCKSYASMSVCTYDTGPSPSPTPPPPAGRPHYGDPAQGCLSDESVVKAAGVPDSFCAPLCGSDGSCPQDKPTGVTANPQCALKYGSDEKCALVCAASLPIRDQKVADSQCGAATCHPDPGTSWGLCTYATPAGQTHYGDPGSAVGNCLSDESVIEITGVPGIVYAIQHAVN
jgi:hypothetical protein